MLISIAVIFKAKGYERSSLRRKEHDNIQEKGQSIRPYYTSHVLIELKHFDKWFYLPWY